MGNQPPPRPRPAREVEDSRRRPIRSWADNGPRQWAVLGLFALAIVLVAGVIVAVA